MISADGKEYREVVCGDCGRPVFHRDDVETGLGWISRCGRRIAKLEACAGGDFCSQIGLVQFDADGALLSKLTPDRPT